MDLQGSQTTTTMLCPVLLQRLVGRMAFLPRLFSVLPFFLERAMLPDKIGQFVGGVEQLRHRACIIVKEIRGGGTCHQRFTGRLLLGAL